MVEAHKTKKAIRLQVTLWQDGKDLSLSGFLVTPREAKEKQPDDLLEDVGEGQPEEEDIPL